MIPMKIPQIGFNFISNSVNTTKMPQVFSPKFSQMDAEKLNQIELQKS